MKCIILCLILFGISACSSEMGFNSEKLSPDLNQKINETKKNANTTIPVIVKVVSSLDEEQRDSITGLGIKIETEAGNIFTTNVNPDQIKSLSKLHFIKMIQLSRQNKF